MLFNPALHHNCEAWHGCGSGWCIDTGWTKHELINYGRLHKKYVDGQVSALRSIPVAGVEKLITLFRKALDEDRQIFVCGNGEQRRMHRILLPISGKVRRTRRIKDFAAFL